MKVNCSVLYFHIVVFNMNRDFVSWMCLVYKLFKLVKYFLLMIIILYKIIQVLTCVENRTLKLKGKFLLFCLFCFLAFDFCRFCVVIHFFHPRHKGQWPPTSKRFSYQILSITFLSHLNSWERASISLFLMSSAKQGNYWYHFYNVFGMTRSLTGDWTQDLPNSKPALYH